MSDASTQTQEKPVAKAKSAPKTTGDFLLDSAAEIEGLTKTKALNLAETLSVSIETNYFKLGGVLALILENSWYDGFVDFGSYVSEKFGFQERKARYLIDIYKELVTKQIPWEKVSILGWTKLKDLAAAGVLTAENADEWVAKSQPLSVIELQKLLAGESGATSSTSATTSDEIIKLAFKLKKDQYETVTGALAKAKGETNTEYDTVALENICAGYLAGTVGSQKSLGELMSEAGWEKAIKLYSEIYPQVNLTIG